MLYLCISRAPQLVLYRKVEISMSKVYHEECTYTACCTAIALQSIHLFQSHCILFSLTHPLPVYTHGYISTPGQYRIDMGVFLALGRPEYASGRPLFGLPRGGGMAQTLLQLPSLCIRP